MTGPTLPLRDYQQEALTAIAVRAEVGVNRALVALPTGAGKTVCFAHLLAQRRERGLILVHRDELVQQSVAKLREIAPDREIGIVKAQQDQYAAEIVVASVQSLHSAKRRARLGRFGTVIVDEAHHAPAPSYQHVLEDVGSFSRGGPLTTGWTATPERADGAGLDAVWQEIVYRRSIWEMVEAGYLCPPTQQRIELRMSLRGVHTRAGDYDTHEVESRLSGAKAPNKAIEAFQQLGEGRTAIAFAISVAHAEQIAERAVAAGIPAVAISGETPEQERRAILKRLERGDLRLVSNCNVLTEGFDCPRVDCLIMARPTKSTPLYVQMLGRGLRTYPGKTDCLVLDLVASSIEHNEDCITTASLLGTWAKERAQSKRLPGPSESEAVDDAEGELVVQLAAFGARKAVWVPVKQARQLSFVLPLGNGGQLALRPETDAEEQWSIWESLPGHSSTVVAGGLSLGYAQGRAEDIARERGAGALIDPKAAWRQQPATEKQRAWLVNRGLWRAGMTAGEAADVRTAFEARISQQGPSRLAAFARR